MKKTALILFALGFFLSAKVVAQESKTEATPTERKYKPDWNYLRIFVGVMPGFEIYNAKEAVLTAALPTGINFRRYSKKMKRWFWEAEAANQVMVLDQAHYVSFAKMSLGIGTSPELFGLGAKSYNVQLHGTYAISESGYNNMVGIGYDVESQSIPISVEYLWFLNSSVHLVLVGIKVPLLDFSF